MEELFDSLAKQTDRDFEVMVTEGTCQRSCKSVCERYADRLNIRYVEKDTGRSQRRNLGMQMASGDYFLLFDSDCILPPAYIATLRDELKREYVDCYGGPDSADASFSTMQKAVNFAMTSLLTTGGIRGKMKDVRKYVPRSFNMGFSRAVFEKTGGYLDMIGEDTDLSMRIKEAGFSVRLIPAAYVYHKRRVTLKSFFHQVNTFGKARILLSQRHPGSLKLTHLFPACFVIGHIGLLLLAMLWHWAWLLPIGAYIVMLFVASLAENKDLKVAGLSILTSYIQLSGYGLGLIEESITHKASKQAAETMYRQ